MSVWSVILWDPLGTIGNPWVWKAIGGKDGISKDMSYHMSRDMPSMASMASMASIAKHGNLHGIK